MAMPKGAPAGPVLTGAVLGADRNKAAREHARGHDGTRRLRRTRAGQIGAYFNLGNRAPEGAGGLDEGGVGDGAGLVDAVGADYAGLAAALVAIEETA